MNIAVLIRNSVDCSVPLPTDDYGDTPIREGMINIINPSDLSALAYGLELSRKENSNLTVLALGSKEMEESLRWCLALGAHHALRVWDEELREADQLGKGKVLAAALTKLKPDLVLCGDDCLDQLNMDLPGVAVAVAGINFVPGIEQLEKIDNGKAIVVRRLDKGKREKVSVRLPALLAVQNHDSQIACCDDLSRLIAALTQPIPCESLFSLGISPERIASRGARVHQIMIRPAKPTITLPVTPDHRLPAEQRLRKIIAGGTVRKQGEIITGTPEQVADKIYNFLLRYMIN